MTIYDGADSIESYNERLAEDAEEENIENAYRLWCFDKDN